MPHHRSQTPFTTTSFSASTNRIENDCSNAILDVLLMFWSGLPADEVAPLARHGVWFFLDHERFLQPASYRLLGSSAPTPRDDAVPAGSGCELAASRAIASSISGPTNLRSIKLSRNNLLWKSASFVTRKLDDLKRQTYLRGLPAAEDASEDGSLRQEGRASN